MIFSHIILTLLMLGIVLFIFGLIELADYLHKKREERYERLAKLQYRRV